jgi:hypothetical protein
MQNPSPVLLYILVIGIMGLLIWFAYMFPFDDNDNNDYYSY